MVMGRGQIELHIKKEPSLSTSFGATLQFNKYMRILSGIE